MRKLTILIISTLILLPILVIADQHESKKTEKQFVIKTNADIDKDELKALIEKSESVLLDGETDVKVFITAGEAMHMIDEYEGDRRKHRHGDHKNVQVIKTIGKQGNHHERTYTTGGHRSMSEGAAKCILKNIDGINSNAAAHLLMQACGALNSTDE